MENLLEVLKKLRSRYPAFGKRLAEVQALGRWDAAVGPQIAKHSRAIRVENGILWVEVDHPIWKTELHHRKRQILDILNKRPAIDLAAERKGPPPKEEPPLVDLFFIDPRNPGPVR